MKITVEHIPVPENEVVLRCPELDEEMLWVLSLLRSGLQRLLVWDQERLTTLLPPGGGGLLREPGRQDLRLYGRRRVSDRTVPGRAGGTVRSGRLFPVRKVRPG